MSENDVIATLADEAASRTVVDVVPGHIAGLVLADDHHVVQFDLDKFKDAPDRKTGQVALTDAASFVHYTERHKAPATSLWGCADRGTVTAVFDDHTSNLAGWGQHRAVLTLKQTREWLAWTKYDGQMLAQTEFAEFLEDWAHCLLKPTPATMLEVAQTFRAAKNVDFESSSRLNSGEIQLTYVESVAAKAGKKGSLSVPESFTLAVAPFVGAQVLDEVTARFRYRINEGNLTMGYRLVNPDQIREKAFADTLEIISTASGLPVLAGVPRA